MSAEPLTRPPRPTTDPSTEKRGPLRRFGGFLASRPAALWRRIRPEKRTQRGMALAIASSALAYGGYSGSRLHTGLGLAADIGIGVGIALVAVLLALLLLALLGWLSRFLPQLFGTVGAGALIALIWLFDETALPPEESALAALAVAVPLAALFGALAVMTKGDFRQQGLFKKATVVLFALAGAGGSGMTVWWLTQDGSDSHLIAAPAIAAEHRPPPLGLDNPGLPGTYAVRTLTYGSGTDRQRPEFGEGVTIETEPVNGKPFASMPTGWRGDVRESYWGFDMGKLPVNGRVWYPDGPGPFPLALIVHGNHHMAEYSDPGYGYLGELLASRGFILVSVDENFFNGGGPAHGGMNKENDARAWMLLEHLRAWRGFNSTEGNPFHDRVDLDNIALMGHSRGGEAVCVASVFNRLPFYPDDASVEFDYGFAIKAIVAIAPVDGQYKPAGRETVMRDVSYFTIHGGHDADMTSFHGDRFYHRLRFSKPGDWFKASLYVYRANHGQFNEVWGPNDSSGPRAWLLNHTALLSGEEQRAIAKVYLSAFLEATLRGGREYVELFRNHHRAREWLPETIVVSRYEDPSFRNVADFEEDVDVTTASVAGGRTSGDGLVVWREADIPLRGGSRRYDTGVFLGWNSEEEQAAATDGEDAKPDEPQPDEVEVTEAAAAVAAPEPARYEVTLPTSLAADWGLTVDSRLVFSLAEAKEKPEAEDYSAEDEGDEAEDADTSEDAGEDEGDEDDTDQDREPIDVSIEIVGRDGAVARIPLSRFGVIVPPMKVETTRAKLLGSRSRAYEPVLQTYELPLGRFVAVEPALRAEEIRAIRWVFDRSPKGVVILDRIGFAR